MLGYKVTRIANAASDESISMNEMLKRGASIILGFALLISANPFYLPWKDALRYDLNVRST